MAENDDSKNRGTGGGGNAPPANPILQLDLNSTAEGEIYERLAQGIPENAQSVKDRAFKGRKELIGDQSLGEGKDVYKAQDKARDSARQIITLWLIGLFCVLIVLSFVALFVTGLQGGFNDDFYKNLRSLLDVLLGPVITLLSSAIGFYFGYQKGAEKTQDSSKDGAPSRRAGN